MANRDGYFQRAGHHHILNPSNTTWVKVLKSRIITVFEEVVNRRTNDSIILRATDRLYYFVSLSSVDAKWGNSVNNIPYFLGHGNWSEKVLALSFDCRKSFDCR